MNSYMFELVFELKPREEPDTYLDALFEAGCDDAIFGTGELGLLGADFNRDSDSAINAIRSAILDVKKAIPHVKIKSFGPDLVNLTEMAARYECTRQNMRKYASGESSIETPFPDSVVEGKTSYWHALDIAMWLQLNTKMTIPNSDIETLKVINGINLAFEQSKREPTDQYLDLLRSISA